MIPPAMTNTSAAAAITGVAYHGNEPSGLPGAGREGSGFGESGIDAGVGVGVGAVGVGVGAVGVGVGAVGVGVGAVGVGVGGREGGVGVGGMKSHMSPIYPLSQVQLLE